MADELVRRAKDYKSTVNFIIKSYRNERDFRTVFKKMPSRTRPVLAHAMISEDGSARLK